MNRIELSPDDLKLPMPPIPRPQDEVVWFNNALRLEGHLVGHDINSRPVIRNRFGLQETPPSFDHIRLKDPFNRAVPNWFSLPAGGKIYRATDAEIATFASLLNRIIPPGPSYLELIEEIWNRGFEIFLVGGTVRDVLSHKSSNDIDLTTTMPLHLAIPLFESMYRKVPGKSMKNGFIRLGGTPESGDPFIDLKVFAENQPGTDSAVFGSSFDQDLVHRDFACNSIYYDPVNKAFIDPSGLGISDARDRKLSIVCDPSQRSRFHQAQIVIRFFKFVCRGFSYDSETADRIRAEFAPQLPSMTASVRIRYVRTQLLSKCSIEEHPETLEEFKSKICEFGLDQLWQDFFEPIKEEILA